MRLEAFVPHFESRARQELNKLCWHEELRQRTSHVFLEAGKRLRPFVACRLYEGLTNQSCLSGSDFLWRAVVAVEMIHTYSLVHDDLPALDDDAFRRGRPTLHTLHGDASAILCGDALLTGAFEVMLSVPTEQAALGARILARSAGGSGMISGQHRDLFDPTGDLVLMHQEKTGALFGASCALGALAADRRDTEVFFAWGKDLGLAFQYQDDLLDMLESRQSLGKTPGKDVAQGKFSAPMRWGVGETQQKILSLVDDLNSRANKIGFNAKNLMESIIRVP